MNFKETIKRIKPMSYPIMPSLIFELLISGLKMNWIVQVY